MWRTSRILSVVGGIIFLAGIGRLVSPPLQPIDPNVHAATEQATDYLGWGTLLLGFMVLASSHYFKLREAKRADRQERREIHDRRQRGDDVH